MANLFKLLGNLISRSAIFAVLLGIFNAIAISNLLAEPSQGGDALLEGGSKASQIKELWSEIELDSKASDIKSVNEKINQLITLQREGGYNDLESYSIVFINHAAQQKSLSNWENASFFLRKAVELSPDSPKVALQAWLISYNGLGDSSLAQFFHILPLMLSRADFLMPLIDLSIYPILWAATFGVLATLILLFASRMGECLKNIALILPRKTRGILAPTILLLLLCVPIFYGPVPCIAIWSGIVILSLPKYRRIGLVGGLLIALWGILIPIKENLSLWLEDPGVRTMLRVSSGAYSVDDLNMLQSLSQARSDDGAALFIHAQVLRRAGRYNEASEQISKASHYLKDERIARAEAATITFLKGDSLGAEQLYEELELKKFKNAALYFNRSKVKFDLLDTEASRDLFHQANQLDSKLIAFLRPIEELYGIKSPVSTADFKLPWSEIIASVKHPMQGVSLLSDRRAASLAPFSTPATLGICGISIILFWIVAAARDKKYREVAYYSRYRLNFIVYGIIRLIPGGASLLNGRVIKGFIIICTLTLLLFPLLRWPVEMKAFGFIINERAIHYTYFVIFLVAACSYIGFHSYNGEEEN